jgi:type IV secretory pathway TrbD component
MRQSEVNHALQAPRLSNGVSTAALGYCWGPGALAAVLTATSVEAYWALVPLALAAAVHAVLRWAYKKDARIFEIYSRYAVLAKSYHPHTRDKLPAGFERPHKVGRGVRL